jgi:opacity protein-like surface antigen
MSNPGDEMGKNKNQETKVKVPVQRKTNDKVNIAVTAATPENDESKNGLAIAPELKDSKDIEGEQKKDSVKAGEEKKKKEVAVAENKTSSSPEKKKPKKNIAGNFGITFSVGPDLSFIKLDKLGKVTLAYGAGLSYTFKKRVTIRAGFYASKKIYVATPDQYYIPPGSYYPGLYEVDAVCKVYEIPVSLSYHFWQRRNHNWFGNAGLSSFLMKNEKYNYVYKNYGQTYNYKTEIKNRNKHYFAVLTLSAGYEYRFNKWLSLQAEPYVKLPLAGVGQGKIKLNSSGMLFTLTVNPFAKKK